MSALWYRDPPEGHLTAQCWCRKDYVHVPRTEVLNGLTRPCERTDCKAADRRHRAQMEAAS